MKLLIVSIFSIALSVSAHTTAQTVNLSGEHLSFKQIFTAIEKQTGYVLFSQKGVLAKAKPVSVSVRNMPMEEVLELILNNQPYEYSIRGKTIFLSEKSAPAAHTPGIPSSDINFKSITGKVVSSSGEALPMASILLKRGERIVKSTVSESNGTFALEDAKVDDIIEVSFTGYNNQTIKVTEKKHYVITLTEAITELSEAVVVGYGSQKRRDVTGSVATIKGKSMQNVAIPSIDKFLQGQVTGVQASTSSGILGEPARIRIRGTNSISNSSDPLYVVDGVPYISGDQGNVTAYNPIGDINPNDIESIEVLKDGSATAIYGSRAANGVILITTKKGSAGTPKLLYDSWFAISEPSKKFDLMNADEFMTITNEKLTNANLPEAAFATLNPETNTAYDTDWQDVILRKGFQHSHSLSLSGGTAKTNYYFSLGYADLQGMVVNNSQRKYNLRARLDQKAFKDKLTIGVNMSLTHSRNNGMNNGTGLSGNVASALLAFPNVPAQWPDGTYNLASNTAVLGSGNNTRGIYGNYTNQLFVLEKNFRRNTAVNITGNSFLDLEIIKGLNARTQIGINYILGEDFQYGDPGPGGTLNDRGSVLQYFKPSFRHNWQNTLTYSKTFDDIHKLSIVAGQEFQKTNSRFFSGEGTNLSSTYFGVNGNIISGSVANQFIGGSANERAFQSLFSRVNYSLLDRYLLTATLRHDKISSLPPGNQGATLPGLSVGWRVSKENFFINSKALQFISDLKLRAGYAKVGNVEIGNYPYAGIFAAAMYGDWTGLQYSQVGNNRLSFETSKKLNIGLDATLWANRVNLTMEYFRNDLNNLILEAPTPPSLGVPNNIISQNVGAMENKGWEFSVNSVNISNKKFKWSSSVNVTLVKNKVTRLVNGATILDDFHVTKEGEAIGMFFGYQSLGVNAANGNPIYQKADGSLVQQVVGSSSWAQYDDKNPQAVNESADALGFDDKRILGQSNPTWFGGINNSFNYGNFDLGIFLTFSGGNKVYNLTRHGQLNNQNFANGGVELLDRWTTLGQQTEVPKLYFSSGNTTLMDGSLTSRFLEDASFLRAQNLSVGYTLPTRLRNKMGAGNIRVSFQVQNAFVITKYTGLDPEVNSNSTSNRQSGVDEKTTPVPRSYTLSLNLSF